MSDPVPAAEGTAPPEAPKVQPPAEKKDTVPTGPMPDQIFRVGGGTDCKRLASAIAGVIENENKRPILEYVGAGAGSQAIKAVAIANTFLSRKGMYATALPTFVSREFKDNTDVTGIQLKLVIHRL